MIKTAVIFLGITFLLAISSGIWLSKKGRPPHAILFGAHKIISLVAIVWGSIMFFRYFKETAFQLNENEIPLVLVASILFALISGVFLSFEKPWIPFFRWTHRIASFLIIVSVVFLLIA